MDSGSVALTTRDEERFWSFVDKTRGCWEWTGTQNGRGYGALHVNRGGKRKTIKAHRLSYEIRYQCSPPEYLHVMHLCDNRICVNPDHLILGTRHDNMQDAARKGKIVTIGKSQFTHCPSGHPYEDDNLYVTQEGHRRCRECTRIQQRLRYLEKNPEIIPRGPRVAANDNTIST